MKKILFFAEGVTLAHVGRPIVLAKALAETGEYDIHFACDQRYKRFLKGLPFKIIDIHSVSPETFLKRVTVGKPLFSSQDLINFTEEDLKIINEIKPDLVVGDMRVSLAISARIAKVSYATVTNAHWSTHAKQNFVLPHHPILGLLGFSAMQFIFNLVRKPIFASLNTPLNKVRKKYGLPSIGSNYMQSHCEADYVLYADIPELVQTYNLPPNHHYIGPVNWAPKNALPEWWDKLKKDVPIIYLGLGSSGKSNLLPELVKGLSELPVQIMAATAGRIDIRDAPHNVFLADYLPGDLCAQRADLVINNGGTGGAYQALCAGVPVLGIIGLMDQHLFMQYVEKTGAGKLMIFTKTTPETVKNTVTKILGNVEYKNSAMKMAEICKNYPVSKIFQNIIKLL